MAAGSTRVSLLNCYFNLRVDTEVVASTQKLPFSFLKLVSKIIFALGLTNPKGPVHNIIIWSL